MPTDEYMQGYGDALKKLLIAAQEEALRIVEERPPNFAFTDMQTNRKDIVAKNSSGESYIVGCVYRLPHFGYANGVRGTADLFIAVVANDGAYQHSVFTDGDVAVLWASEQWLGRLAEVKHG